jgi:thymidylate synthase
MPSYFSIIYAVGPNGEFAFKNNMPWPRIKEDLQYFKSITIDNNDSKKSNIVIMGRNTFESLGSTILTSRINIVISTKLAEAKQEYGIESPYITAGNLDDALEKAGSLVDDGKANKIFVIGGVKLLEKSYNHDKLEYVYETLIEPLGDKVIEADKYLAPFVYMKCRNRLITEKIMNTNDGRFRLTFSKFVTIKNSQEHQYLDLCNKILHKGINKIDRTLVGTLSLWGEHLTFNLNEFPLYTTKKVYWKGIVAELIFFISGKTNTKLLEAQNVNIWKGNTSRDYLDKYGFYDYNEGEIGTSYPFQWRHFGAEYKPNIQLEIGQGGFDQLQWVIDSIKAVKNNHSDPRGRRLIVTAWNPLDVHKAVLPPCHNYFQFSIVDDKLNCLVNMRSNDMGSGNSFNVASYSLLTYMISYLVDLKPGTLVLNMADCHIYTTHIEAIKEQITRPPRQFPKLEIVGKYSNIDEFTIKSFNLIGYYPHDSIKMEMAV